MKTVNTTSESINSVNAQLTESSACSVADVNSKPPFERLAQVMWALILIVPLSILQISIIPGLARNGSLQVYVFNTLIWCAVFFGYVAVVFSRWNKVSHFPKNWTGGILAVGGLACYVGSIFTRSIEIASLGWVMQAGAWLATHSGADDSNRWRLLIHFPALCILLRLPEFVTKNVALAYQQLLSTTTASLFDFSSIPFRLEGSNFEFARSALSIDELLANSQYIGWMLFVCCLVVAWLRRPIVLLPIYLGVALFWVFGVHILQMFVLGFTQQGQGLDLSWGWQSSLLSALSLLAAVGLLLSSDRCLRILFMPVPYEASSRYPSNPLVGAWNRFLLPLAANYKDES